ncbi:CYTH domain-containing protein [Candidatus Poribacteria bacterium]|nr:CYTH domain-containing protein [Candidatus Poribacteria bacterium]
MDGDKTLEIESKYSTSDFYNLEKLLKTDELGIYLLKTLGEKDVIDYYLDTSEYQIQNNGYACRIRNKGSDWILTLKSLGKVKEAIHEREEYEINIPGFLLLSDWPESKIKNIVVSFVKDKPLYKICVIKQHRIQRIVNIGEKRIGIMSLDTVEISINDSINRTYEVEVELCESGKMKDLKNLDVELKLLNLLPESCSKFERAMEIKRKLNGD